MLIDQLVHKVNFFKVLSVTMLSGILVLFAACSDNTGAIGGDSGTPPTGSVAATIQLLVSNQQMQSSAIATSDLTAVVLDGAGQAISGKAVVFSQGNDNTAYFTNIEAITDSSGIAKATLNIGTDMSNRVIDVSATADTAVGASAVAVVGTKISISGNTSLALNALSTLTIIVKNSLGAAVSDVVLTVTSQNGNPVALNPASGITDANGQITATVTASNAGAGTDVLTITGAGDSQTQTLTINSASFSFTAPVTIPPATTPEILVNTPTPVSVTWLNPGAVVGSQVLFNSSRGSITGSPATTNGSGVATVNISAASTGTTIITASGASGTPAASIAVVFITATASTVTAQASPSTVGVNPVGSQANQSVLSVVVRDVSNNLVKNAHVTFNQAVDVTGGHLATAAATTDITGTASVNYVAGSISSGQNGVRIDITVDAVNGVAIPPVATSLFLTVASQALFVRLGTDNEVYPDTPVAGVHTKEYTALVTDAAGNPAPDGTEVRFTLRPAPLGQTSFMKGWYVYNPDEGRWVRYDDKVIPTLITITAFCLSEDANLNGLLELGEDINGNTFLDPVGVATVNATATIVSGFAIAKISYAKEYATWAIQELEARAGTVGNDPPSVVTFVLPGLGTDYTSPQKPPPGAVSPFGAGDPNFGNNVCTNAF